MKSRGFAQSFIGLSRNGIEAHPVGVEYNQVVVEAQPGVVEDYQGVLQANPGAVEDHHGVLEAHPGSVEHHQGVVEALGVVEYLITWCCIKLRLVQHLVLEKLKLSTV